MSLTGAFIRNVIIPLWSIKEKSPFLKYLPVIEGMQRRPIEAVHDNQLQRLKSLVRHAGEQTSYYRDRFAESGVTPDSIQTLADLQRFPLLTKDDLRANKEKMMAPNISKDRLISKKTSGSTGVAVEFCIDEASNHWKRAVTVVYDRWSGWDIGERVGAIWGNPECYQSWRLYVRNMFRTRHIYLDTLKMDEPTMRGYHANLLRKKPVILYGHAHSLFLFARFMELNGLSGICPKGIISTCMVLHSFERATIERVFGCRVSNRYGCEEVSLIACECPNGNMHLNYDSLIVEILRDGKGVPAGEPGSIVVTDLTNYGMPFIRYKVGDVGVLSSETTCSCGCTYPILASLEGRVADYVVTPDGQYISGISLTENFAMHLPGVKQMQIVQQEIDSLVFNIVKGETFSEQTLLDLNGLARERFGPRMQWRIEYFNTIQSEISGKYRFCISYVDNPFL